MLTSDFLILKWKADLTVKRFTNLSLHAADKKVNNINELNDTVSFSCDLTVYYSN